MADATLASHAQQIFYPNGALYRLASGPAGEELVSMVDATLDTKLSEAELDARWEEIADYLQENVWLAPICFSQHGYMFPDDVQNVENMSWVWGNISDFRYLYRTGD